MTETLWIIMFFIAAIVCITSPYWSGAIVDAVANLADKIQENVERRIQ